MGNTGVSWTNSQEAIPAFYQRSLTPDLRCLVDWLQGTYPEANFAKVKDLVESIFSGNFQYQEHGLRFYRDCWKMPTGAILGRTPIVGGKVLNRTDAYIEFGGSVLGQLEPEKQRELFRGLAALGFRASRLDDTIDDYNRTFSPADFRDAHEAGNVVGYRWAAEYHSKNIVLENLAVKVRAKSQSFRLGKRGSKGSGKSTICYDKWAQTQFEIPSVRIETTWSGERADEAFRQLCKAEVELWSQLIGGRVFGSVDFVDRTASSRPDRCPRLDWWQKVVDQFTKIKLSTTRKLQTYEKAVRWINRQVAPTLAMILNIFATKNPGEDPMICMWQLWLDGEQRFNDFHRWAILQNT